MKMLTIHCNLLWINKTCTSSTNFTLPKQCASQFWLEKTTCRGKMLVRYPGAIHSFATLLSLPISANLWWQILWCRHMFSGKGGWDTRLISQWAQRIICSVLYKWELSKAFLCVSLCTLTECKYRGNWCYCKDKLAPELSCIFLNVLLIVPNLGWSTHSNAKAQNQLNTFWGAKESSALFS